MGVEGSEDVSLNLMNDSWVANFVSLGDGWHNNHHGSPSAWYTGKRWWELDPMGWIIWVIKK